MLTAIVKPVVAAGLGYPAVARSALIADDPNRGVKWAFDLSRTFSYDGVSPVPNGATVRNLAELFSERDTPVDAGDTVIANTVTFADGGMDFSAITAHGNYVRGPATAAAAIYANSQYYLSITCLKLPSSADWSETTTSIVPFHTWTAGVSGYAANLDIASTGFLKSGSLLRISHFRQSGTLTPVNVGLTVPTTAAEKFAMVASWRDGSEQGLSMTTELGVVTATPAATGANNDGDFSALRSMRGIVGPLWTPQIANNAHKWKLYSGFDEAIGLSGRNVQAVIAEHWVREKAKWDAGIYA